jgi:16S rRNA (guanine966-N2)-methyltransferase
VTRVVAGDLGGRRLAVPAGRATRPTSERVREALFSSVLTMRGSLGGAGVLDLYAGSGAVGIEAASRGAARVTCVERDPRALAVLRSNLDALGLTIVEVSTSPVERVLSAQPAAPYDVVFVDPPYAEPVDQVLAMLDANGWLTSSAVVVVERATRDSPPLWPPGIRPDRSRRYGDTTLWYGRRP